MTPAMSAQLQAAALHFGSKRDKRHSDGGDVSLIDEYVCVCTMRVPGIQNRPTPIPSNTKREDPSCDMHFISS